MYVLILLTRQVTEKKRTNLKIKSYYVHSYYANTILQKKSQYYVRKKLFFIYAINDNKINKIAALLHQYQ